MSPSQLSKPVAKHVTHHVMVRTADAYNGAMNLPINGEQDGWVLEPRLRCERIDYKSGAQCGSAAFSYVPQNDADRSIESGLDAFGTDDQVQVMVFPYDDPMVHPADPAQNDDGSPNGFVLFEGVLSRHVPQLKGGANSSEGVGFVAFPMAVLDNELVDHLITGRWISNYVSDQGGDTTTHKHTQFPDLGTDRAFVVETPTLPATFNHRGRPNMSTVATLTNAGHDLDAALFTHDDDPTGDYWTLGRALASLLAVWLFGAKDTQGGLSRNLDIEAETFNALKDPQAAASAKGDQWKGFDDRLKETSVHGMGVLDAVELICKSHGYDMGVVANQKIEKDRNDRRYLLRIWRKGQSGDKVWFDLSSRSDTEIAQATSESMLAQNTLSEFNGVKDARECASVIVGRARTFFESPFKLLPLWDPADVSDDGITLALQDEYIELLDDGDTYQGKHVEGGVSYQRYGHVGRTWGLDCVGGFTGYTDDTYGQATGGFDFVTELGITDDSVGYGADRASLDLDPDTAPIAWTKRVRQALPMRSPLALLQGVEFFLECSEDTGAHWHDVPRNACSFSTLRSQFGIRFDGIKNLANVNIEFFRTGTPVFDVSKSWWGLISDTKLLFRLTCVIEGDSAFRYDTPQQADSGSAYQRGKLLLSTVEQTWISPKSAYNMNSDGSPTNKWQNVPGWGASASTAETIAPDIKAIALREQDKLQKLLLRASASSFLVYVDRWSLGQAVQGVRGRNVSFAVNGGTASEWPNIIGLTYHLSSGKDQRIEFTLDDRSMQGDTTAV